MRLEEVFPVHVMPIDDLREHVESFGCPCGVTVEFVDGDKDQILVIHTSYDGRELVEQHGIN